MGRDPRFTYLEQTMLVDGAPTSNVMYRAAVTNRDGLVRTDEMVAEMGFPDWNPPLPDWAAKWAEAERLRPWPPEPMI